MKTYIAASIATSLLATSALASGLDRTGQPIGLIFEEGTYVELGFATTSATIEGTDLLGNETGDVGESFNMISGGYKTDLNQRLSLAIIFDQPWGVDVAYPGAGPATTAFGDDPLLEGTMAEANSNAVTALLRYKFNDRFSVHGGIRYQEIDGEITLSGDAYNASLPASGYNVKVGRDGAFGWVAGAAYEIPDIALRLALTYQSEIEHDFDLTETFPVALGGTVANTSTKTKTPQSVNIDFQTGIAQNTLLFGGIRWAEHSVTDLVPTAFGRDLIDLDDSVTYTLGIGRKFNENWSGSLAYIYEDVEGDDLVSPLAPVHGLEAIRIGVQYQNDKIKVAAGLRYTKLGDAVAAPGGTAAANFDDNDAISIGLKVGYYF
jgi:long-subunit fatty acid transport protein